MGLHVSFDIAIPTASWSGRPKDLLEDLGRELLPRREHVGRIMVAEKDSVYFVENTLFEGDEERIEDVPDPLNGPAINRNKCLPFIESEWIVFLDDDVRLVPGWGDQIMGLLASEPTCDFIGGQILARRPRNWFSQAAEDFVIRHKQQSDGWYLAAAHLVARSDALKALDGFDRSFIYGGEDWDLSKRAIVSGFSTGVSDALAVTHAHPTTFTALMAKAGQYGKAEALFEDSPLGAEVAEQQRQALETGSESHSFPLKGALTWPARQFQEFRSLGRSRLRSARSTVLYAPWMLRYMRNSASR